MLSNLRKILASGDLEPKLLKRFEAEEEVSRIPNFRIASCIGLLFLASGAVLDCVAFPEIWKSLALIRVGCAFVLILFYCLLCMDWGKRNYLVIGHLMEAALILGALLMINITGGVESPYFAALILLIVGSSLLLRWSIWQGLVSATLSCGGFFLLTWLTSSQGDDEFRSLLISLFFLFVTGFFATACAILLYNLRLKGFVLREELQAERLRIEENNHQLREQDAAKTDFFANISHELRTPLTLILGPLEEVTKFGVVQENPKLRNLVRSMEQNGIRLLRLINELLDIIKLDGDDQQAKMEIGRLDEMMDSLHASLLPTAQQKGIELTYEVAGVQEKFFSFDVMKFEKILLNLAGNALKFTSSGETVHLSCCLSGEREVEFKVADTGCGISEREQENIFRRFYQADSSAKRRHRGAGIGLSLVKGLVDVLGGKIELESKEEKGSTFTVRLPLRLPKESSVEANGSMEDPQREIDRRALVDEQLVEVNSAALEDEIVTLENLELLKSSGEKPVILVADDEPGVLDLISNHLKDYELILAPDGELAYQMAIKNRPDLVLLDWMMPERDGLEVCRMLRATEGMQRVPVVMLTARVDEESKTNALREGANDFLTKPFSPSELRLRVQHLLANSDYQKKLLEKSRELESAISELRESESMLVQAEKLTSLGQMSAGIIHEINNPLNYAKTNVFSLRTFSKLLPVEDRDDFIEVTADIEEGLERVVQIVKDLRGFAVKDKTHFTDVNVAEVVAASSRLIGNRLSKISFFSDVPDHIHVSGNSNQLCQVFLNFIQNSLDALKDVNRENEHGKIEIRCVQYSEWVTLSFQDNGCGISEENQQKIFDPFYTSKDVGKGMGLGLSICYRILGQHGSKIEIESEVGSGTKFNLHFPIILDGSGDNKFKEKEARFEKQL